MGAEPNQYILATIHRPENTDDPQLLQAILDEPGKLGLPCAVPAAPADPARRRPARPHSHTGPTPGSSPADHRTFLGLARHARLIVTDSGGVQEKCTVLKRPLIVVKNSTERPEAIDAGFTHLVQPGPATGELGRRLIGDRTRASASPPRPARSGRRGRRADNRRRTLLPPSTARPRKTAGRVRKPAASNRAGVTGHGQPPCPARSRGLGPRPAPQPLVPRSSRLARLPAAAPLVTRSASQQHSKPTEGDLQRLRGQDRDRHQVGRVAAGGGQHVQADERRPPLGAVTHAV
jgi:UDP-N-acetylglucosamine 2-epimerase (non-hydrolysing)